MQARQGVLQLLDGRRFDEAAAVLRRRCDAGRDLPFSMRMLAWTLLQLGELDEAERLARQLLGDAPAEADFEYLLGLVMLERDDGPAAASLFENASRRSSGELKYIAALATACVRAGFFDQAGAAYARAGRLEPGLRPLWDLVRLDRAFYEEIGAAAQAAAPELVADKVGVSPQGVLLVATDKAYLARYGATFLTSAAARLPAGWGMHFHVMQPEPATLRDLEKRLAGAGIGRYAISAGDNERADPAATTVWFTCERFYHLSAWLDRYACPIAVADIDMSVEQPLSRLAERVAHADLALERRRPRSDPWLEVSAGAVVARPSEPARRYFRLVRGYLHDYRARNALRWHLDQSALYCTLRMMETYATGPKISWLKNFDGVLRHVGRDHISATGRRK